MINNKTLYSIEALCALARSKDYSSTAQKIADSTGISSKFLPQILSDLSRAGLVRSTRGFGGGVRLAQDPKKISLLTILESAQSNMFFYDAFIKHQDSDRTASNNTLKAFKKVQKVTKDEFAKITLADLAKKSRGRKV